MNIKHVGLISARYLNRPFTRGDRLCNWSEWRSLRPVAETIAPCNHFVTGCYSTQYGNCIMPAVIWMCRNVRFRCKSDVLFASSAWEHWLFESAPCQRVGRLVPAYLLRPLPHWLRMESCLGFQLHYYIQYVLHNLFVMFNTQTKSNIINSVAFERDSYQYFVMRTIKNMHVLSFYSRDSNTNPFSVSLKVLVSVRFIVQISLRYFC